MTHTFSSSNDLAILRTVSCSGIASVLRNTCKSPLVIDGQYDVLFVVLWVYITRKESLGMNIMYHLSMCKFMQLDYFINRSVARGMQSAPSFFSACNFLDCGMYWISIVIWLGNNMWKTVEILSYQGLLLQMHTEAKNLSVQLLCVSKSYRF